MAFKDPAARKEYAKVHYKANRQKYLDRAIAKNAEYEARAKAIIEKAKDRPCCDCGKQFPSVSMDFDHLDAEQKIDNIGRMARRHALAKLEVEIAKCEVVCANCHRVRTEIRRRCALGARRFHKPL